MVFPASFLSPPRHIQPLLTCVMFSLARLCLEMSLGTSRSIVITTKRERERVDVLPTVLHYCILAKFIY